MELDLQTNLHSRRAAPVRVHIAFAMLACGSIFIQKIGLPVPGMDGSFGVSALVLWGVLLWLLIKGAATIDPLRALLFGCVLVCVTLSMSLQLGIYSLPAVVLLLGLYGSMIVRIDVDQATMFRCLNTYQNAMIGIAVIVIGQQLVQYTIGNQYWPNMNKLVPSSFLIPAFMYLRPYSYGSPLLTPQGFFFLEPSACSLFLALAVTAEIVLFKRIRRIVLYGTAVLIAMAGTGITILAVISPLLLIKMDPQLRKWALRLVLPAFLVAASFGAFSFIIDRSAELSEAHSSGYGRMVVPFNDTMELLSDPTYLFSGNGPGSTPHRPDTVVQWPANKLIFEYGILTAITFHVYMLVSVLGAPISRTLALVALIPILFFGGGFVMPATAMILIMFGSLLRLTPESASEKAVVKPHLEPRYAEMAS